METGVVERTPAFGVQGTRAGGVTALRATGRLVVGAGAGDATWQSTRDWRGAGRVEVDLCGVTAIDAGGVGALLRLRESAGRHGVPVVIGAAGPRVRRVLQLTRLEAAFGLPAILVPGTDHRAMPGSGIGHALAGSSLCRCA